MRPIERLRRRDRIQSVGSRQQHPASTVVGLKPDLDLQPPGDRFLKPRLPAAAGTIEQRLGEAPAGTVDAIEIELRSRIAARKGIRRLLNEGLRQAPIKSDTAAREWIKDNP